LFARRARNQIVWTAARIRSAAHTPDGALIKLTHFTGASSALTGIAAVGNLTFGTVE
jgi:hypothetical protein